MHIREIAKKALQADSTVPVKNFEDIGRFLQDCEYISDEEQFNSTDYWQTPDEFEKTRRGDCEDFALWSWKKFLDLGLDARFTYGSEQLTGHAWVTIHKGEEAYIFEATSKPAHDGSIGVLSVSETDDYLPVISIDKNLNFYRHKK